MLMEGYRSVTPLDAARINRTISQSRKKNETIPNMGQVAWGSLFYSERRRDLWIYGFMAVSRRTRSIFLPQRSPTCIIVRITRETISCGKSGYRFAHRDILFFVSRVADHTHLIIFVDRQRITGSRRWGGCRSFCHMRARDGICSAYEVILESKNLTWCKCAAGAGTIVPNFELRCVQMIAIYGRPNG